MKRLFIVSTHLAEEPTVAVSAAKAMNNVMFRYRRMGYYGPYDCWNVWEVR